MDDGRVRCITRGADAGLKPSDGCCTQNAGRWHAGATRLFFLAEIYLSRVLAVFGRRFLRETTLLAATATNTSKCQTPWTVA